MALQRNTVETSKFNSKAALPFELRLKDFEIAMQDVYDFFFDVNHWLVEKGLTRLDDMLRPAITSGDKGVEIKTTRKAGGAVDTHGARDQWMCVFVYEVDNEFEPAIERKPLKFTEVYLGKVTVADFRKNPRSELGTRTATLHKEGIAKLRQNWIYRV